MKTKIIGAIAIVGFVVLLGSSFSEYLSLEYIKSQQASFQAALDENYLCVASAFFCIYVLATSLSVPGAAMLTLAAGAMFGLWIGTLIVSFASTLGATLAFLSSRYLLRNSVEARLGGRLKGFKDGMAKDGPFFLFTLRVVPIIPFFVINLVMGLLPISAKMFWAVSQAGMLAGTVVYVNAGTQIAEIREVGDILSPDIMFSFLILGFFPLIAKKGIEYWKAKREMQQKDIEKPS